MMQRWCGCPVTDECCVRKAYTDIPARQSRETHWGAVPAIILMQSFAFSDEYPRSPAL